MRAGALRDSVNIERPVETTDNGRKKRSWEVVASGVRCKIEPKGGMEWRRAEQVAAEANYAITMRVGDLSLRPEMRLVDQRNTDRTFEVVAVVDVMNRGREYRLDCKEEWKTP